MGKFDLGRTVMTATVGELIKTEEVKMEQLQLMLSRHVNADWGVLDKMDYALNDRAIIHGGRILSKYVEGNHWFYVITEADRSYTTVMLCSDY